MKKTILLSTAVMLLLFSASCEKKNSLPDAVTEEVKTNFSIYGKWAPEGNVQTTFYDKNEKILETKEHDPTKYDVGLKSIEFLSNNTAVDTYATYNNDTKDEIGTRKDETGAFTIENINPNEIRLTLLKQNNELLNIKFIDGNTIETKREQISLDPTRTKFYKTVYVSKYKRIQ